MWTACLLVAASINHVQSTPQTITETLCPPLGAALSLDQSGSMKWEACPNYDCAPECVGNTGYKCAEATMENVALELIGYIAMGPAKTEICGNAFGWGVLDLFECTDNFPAARHSLQTMYSLNNNMQKETQIGGGAETTFKQLKKLKDKDPDLVRIAIFFTDGAPNPGSEKQKAIDFANKIKNELDGIVMYVGFSGHDKGTGESMAGNKDNTCGDGCIFDSTTLQQAKDKLTNGFCETITTIIPPTPKPTQEPCAADENIFENNLGANKDMPWKDCDGGLCNKYPYHNGSSVLCVEYRRRGFCNDILHNCRCSCQENYDEDTHKGAGRCCQTSHPTASPTKFPTPSPGEPTQTPTPLPTENPTLKLPEQPTFNFYFAGLSDWTAAEDILRKWFADLKYDFDTEWQLMIDQGRVKTKLLGETQAKKFKSSELFTVPFKAFDMLVWMPDKFYLTTTIPLNAAASTKICSFALILVISIIRT